MSNSATIRMLSLILILPLSLAAQDDRPKEDPPAASAKTSNAPTVPTRTIDLTYLDSLNALPNAGAFSYASGCSSNGTVYSAVHAVTVLGSGLQQAEIYAADEQRNVTKVALAFPTTYKQINIRQFYPAEHRAVVLLQATQPSDPNVILKPGQSVSLISSLDLDTGEQRIVSPDATIQVVKAAIFDSGKLLVLGLDATGQTPVLALLHEDGTLQQTIELDPRDYQPLPPARQPESPRLLDQTVPAVPQRQVARALANAQFVPWGNAILLVQPGLKQRIYKVRDSGEQDVVLIVLPENARMLHVLGSSGKDTWIVTAVQGQSSTGGQRSSNTQSPSNNLFFEIDPFTGNVLDQLVINGPRASQVACAADGRVTAIYLGPADPATGQQNLGYAAAPR